MIKVFAALADPLRLRILETVRQRGEACGKELAAQLGVSVALLSHHAKILEDAGLLIRRREGQFIRFSVNQPVLEELRCSPPLVSCLDDSEGKPTPP